ncbi:MAG: hypothetical protein SOW48_04050 [Peptoniphilaceae bacterium]|nr:hypothetical protein [Peptoniphilaceae bacterium]MDD7434052.1 hypothetical protein [Peptoniphilaceae bacterium]MDY3075801.1 hypothetical protein [Peptoniphilaceae bacterium]MDY4196127.1 hypothetical protein [Peptoniphilaceae bacterium]MDY5842594.1 hypothetical protein [Peptoniphilaceae bacterium]
MDTIQLQVPSKPEYVTTLRLVTAAFARQLAFDVEKVEDLRVCVSEAVNYLLPDNESLTLILSESNEGMIIQIQAKRRETQGESDSLHHMILATLLDEVEESPNGIQMRMNR